MTQHRKKSRADRERDRRRREQRSRLVSVAAGAGVNLDASGRAPEAPAAEPEAAVHRTVTSAEILSGGGPRAVTARPAPAPTPEPSRIIRPPSGFALKPTANRWLNERLPRVLPPSWREREDLGDSDHAVYTSTSGLAVRVSGARRRDACRWVYLDISRDDRDPSPADIAEARDLVLGPETIAFQVLVARSGSVPRYHALVVFNVDRFAFPPAAGPNDEYA